MAFFGAALKLVVNLEPTSKLTNAVFQRIILRSHSHSTLSSKRKIQPTPKQPQEKYEVDYKVNGGLLGWADWAMKKDHRKREGVVKWGCERNLVNTIRKNDILPREIREIADKEVVRMPRDSNYINVIKRCCITSRGRRIVVRWRLSRYLYRHLADYNKLSGVQRAIW